MDDAIAGQTDGPAAITRFDACQQSLLSPSIQLSAADAAPAFELKMVLPQALAEEIEAWATGAMERDCFCLAAAGDSYVGSSRVDLQACKLEYSIVSPK